MFNHDMTQNHIDDIFGHNMHAKRALSLANTTTLGVIESRSMAGPVCPLFGRLECHGGILYNDPLFIHFGLYR